MSSIERITIKLPPNFDPHKHQSALLSAVSKEHGEGFEIDNINLEERVATASRQAATTEVKESTNTSKDVRLQRGTKTSDGDKVEAKMMDQHPGFYMTSFEPYLGRATLTKLNDAEARCRGAIAVALGCKGWDITVKQRKDGGFDLVLPRNYQPSKGAKITEVAEQVVGRPGWYASIDAQKLTASIIPSDPPTFPNGISFPIKRLGKGNIDVVPFGMILPEPGAENGPEITLDWTASAWALIAGTPGSGKSVTLNAIIADALSNGSELVVVDDVSKAVDFEWCKPFCRPGGWGCDSIEQGVAALGLVREEGKKRAQELKRLGINNWLDMPKGKRFTPILVIVDEVSALVVPDPTPKGVPKDHPLMVEIAERNLARAMLQSYMRKIIAELRFVGVRMVLSTQATNANTGVDPGLRTLIGHKILQGVNPSKAARGQIFPDETAVLTVPENVKAGGMRAKGVGVAALESQAPACYKSYFASIGDYQAALRAVGVKENGKPEPTAAQIDRFLPSLDDGKDDRGGERAVRGGGDRAPSGKSAAQVAAEMGDTVGMAAHDGSMGTGFEKANNMRNLAAGGGQTRTQKTAAKEEAEWAAQSGEVTVRKVEPVPVPAAPAKDDW